MLSDEWLSRYELLENFEIILGRSVMGTQTQTTGVSAIALLVLRMGELKTTMANYSNVISTEFWEPYLMLFQCRRQLQVVLI